MNRRSVACTHRHCAHACRSHTHTRLSRHIQTLLARDECVIHVSLCCLGPNCKGSLTLLIIWGPEKAQTHMQKHTHTHTYSLCPPLPFLFQNLQPEHKSISDGLESIIMMKPGGNSSTSVADVIQQSRHELGFCTSFYLSCTLTRVTFIWSDGTTDKRPKWWDDSFVVKHVGGGDKFLPKKSPNEPS